MQEKKTALDVQLEGLVLMIIFTILWANWSEKFFDNSDYHVVGIVSGIAVLYLIYNFVKLKTNKKSVSVPPLKSGKKKAKWYFLVVAFEIVAIFGAVIILTNIGRGHLIPSSIALIVGLHFLPMAKIFNRNIDYYIGFWTIIIAIIGLLLISNNQFDYQIVSAFVCTGCAISTTTYGFKMAKDGNVIIKKYKM